MLSELFKVIWFSAAPSFMVVSIGVGILQSFRRDKEWWDLPRFVWVLVACRRAFGHRCRNPYCSGTGCALARASFRLVVNEPRHAAIDHQRPGAADSLPTLQNCQRWWVERTLSSNRESRRAGKSWNGHLSR